MQAAYDVNIAELRDHLRATTSKAITETIIEVCNATREGRECELDDEWDPTLKAIAQAQITAGQRALTGGLWPARWKEQQQAYNNRSRSKNLPAVWMATTLIIFQDVLFKMWLARNDALHNSEDSACNET